MSTSDRSLEIIILAAGLGTRMKSSLPKVLHRVADEPMLGLLMQELDLIMKKASAVRFNVVVGHGREQVIQSVKDLKKANRIHSPVVFTVQAEQLGTGHAVKLALEQKSDSKTVAVFNGDLPLFTADCFQQFLDAHLANKSFASLASTTIDDAGQYGRVLRKGKTFIGVVEYKDASIAQRKIKEYNGGVYLFDRQTLDSALKQMKNKNASKEFYLPDVFEFARKKKKKIHAHHFDDPHVLAGVNNMKELAQAQKFYYQRTAEKLMIDGVFLPEPEHTYVGARVKVGAACVIGPFTTIRGDSVLGDRVRVGAFCDLKDVQIGDDTLIRNSIVAEGAVIGKECAVGPMTHFRPGTKLHDHVRVGNFVEIKKSEVGSHTSAAHLSYIGDAEIGSHVNIGCGFVTCNYDGKEKHKTVIGNHVFIGSDSQLVAPITISDGTYVASGSTVTETVKEKDSLVIARTRQVTKPGYARRYKK